MAKKLIKTGAIDSIKKSVAERAKAEKSTGFKRSQGLERKLTGMTDNARAGYQPFTVIIKTNVLLAACPQSTCLSLF